MASESPILQVPEPDNTYNQDDLIYQQQDDDGFDNVEDAIPQVLKLNLRGTRIDLDRDTLVNLPESLLIAMFPNGLTLGRHDDGFVDDEEEFEHQSRDSADLEEQIVHVDFDPACLEYVLRFYRFARESHTTGDDNSPQHRHQLLAASATSPMYYPLLTKEPIIVLREELEYFCIPPAKTDMAALKRACGQYLKQHAQIFDALQKNISRENNIAEQHLIDMLCDAGFRRDDEWGYRELEPTKTCVISMALVLLKTTGPENHMATAQKLLLFWRKPARKCWWDGNTVEIEGQSVRLWARRTWTLELALV